MSQRGNDHFTPLQAVFLLARQSPLPLFQPRQIWPSPGSRELHPEFYPEDRVVLFSLDHRRELFAFESRAGDESPITLSVAPWLFDRGDQRHLLRNLLATMAEPPAPGAMGALWRRCIEHPILALGDQHEMLPPDNGPGGLMQALALGVWQRMRQLLNEGVKSEKITIMGRGDPGGDRKKVAPSAWPGVSSQLDFATSSTWSASVLDIAVEVGASSTPASSSPTRTEIAKRKAAEIRAAADRLWPDGCPENERDRGDMIRSEIGRSAGYSNSTIKTALTNTKHKATRAKRRNE